MARSIFVRPGVGLRVRSFGRHFCVEDPAAMLPGKDDAFGGSIVARQRGGPAAVYRNPEPCRRVSGGESLIKREKDVTGAFHALLVGYRMERPIPTRGLATKLAIKVKL